MKIPRLAERQALKALSSNRLRLGATCCQDHRPSDLAQTAPSTYKVAFDCILKQSRVGFEPEGFHHLVFVKSYCSWLQVQDAGNLFHRLAFGKQLQDLALARRNPLFFCVGAATPQKEVNCLLGNGGRHVRLRSQRSSNGPDQFFRCGTLHNVPGGSAPKSFRCHLR